jgi:signal transduction histidine kinase
LGIFAGNGYAQLYLWPHSPDWNEISQTVLLSIGGSLGLIFTMRFLKTRSRLPHAHRFMTGLAYVYGIIAMLLVASLWITLSRPFLYQSMFLVSLVSPLAALYVSVRIAHAGHNSAVYFLVSWSVFCIGVLTAALRLLGLVPSNNFTLYALQICSGIEMLLFSLALAYRFQFERLRREEAQSEALAAKEEVISAIKASEERLERAVDERTLKLQKLLLSEQHMREQYVRFGALIAHEFRNPLNNIAAQASILEMDPEPSPEKTNKRTNVIRGAVNRLMTLFDQWLESDRLNMAVNEIHTQPISLASWLAEVHATCTSYHPEHTIELAPCLAKAWVNGDDHLLQIALLNLIDNACKYSPEGSAIMIFTETLDDNVGISIKDSGCGIAADQIEAVLEPYSRGEHQQSAIKGVGLGLAFVNRIVQLHHGRIVIDSQPGVGTSITLWLPVLKQPANTN